MNLLLRSMMDLFSAYTMNIKLSPYLITHLICCFLCNVIIFHF